MTTRKIALAATLLALATLGGCNWFKPAPPPETSDNATATEDNVAAPTRSAPPANEAAPTEANAAAATTAAEVREAPPAPDAQTQDDADATGMTAHVRRDEAAANTTAP